jgi:hypothetical protein
MALKRINKELTDLGRYVHLPSLRYQGPPARMPSHRLDRGFWLLQLRGLTLQGSRFLTRCQ